MTAGLVAATLVWLAPAPPDVDQHRALAALASERGVRLVAPNDALPATPAMGIDPRVADAIDDSIERARDAMSAMDAGAVDEALASAESLLRAHPELPQGAWQMAEIERERALRWRRVPPRDLEAAERAWQRAAALDGGRSPGLGEEDVAQPGAAAELTLDVPAGVSVRFDGRTVPDTIVSSAGPHVVAVEASGAPIWAAWLDLPQGRTSVRPLDSLFAPCSSQDMRDVGVVAGVLRSDRVRCERWLAATAGPAPGSVRVAACEEARCGPWIDERAPEPPQASAELDVGNRALHGGSDRRHGWPAWGTWTLVGAGAAIATAVAIVASGVLRKAPAETQFVDGGLVHGP